MPSKRLLWIHQNFVTAHQPGNSRAIYQITSMLEQGWHVDVVTGDVGYLEELTKGQKSNKKVEIEREGRLTIHRLTLGGEHSRLHNRITSYLQFLAKAFRYCMQFEDVDLFYATSPPLPQLTLSLFLSIYHHAPFVLELRDIWPLFLEECGMLHSKPLLWSLQWFEATCYHFSDHIVPLTPAFRSYLRHFSIPKEKCTIVPSGADPRFAKPKAEASGYWRRKLGLEEHTIIVYTGSFNEAYNIPHILEQADLSTHKHQKIAWIFAGNGRHRQQVVKACENHSQMHYVGALPRDQMIPLLHESDIGLITLTQLPSLETVLPGKLFDYMAAGIPVLSLIKGQAGTLIEQADAGLVLQPGGLSQLQKLIQIVYEWTPEERNQMGLRGQEWFFSRLSVHHTGKRTLQAIEQNHLVQGRLRRIARLLGSSVKACGDVWNRRSQCALDSLLEQNEQETSMLDWLQSLSPQLYPDPMILPSVLGGKIKENELENTSTFRG